MVETCLMSIHLAQSSNSTTQHHLTCKGLTCHCMTVDLHDPHDLGDLLTQSDR